jgi:hypothetical protein
VAAGPEGAAVVAEEVGFQGDGFRDRGGGGRGGEAVGVEVEPGVVGAVEGLDPAGAGGRRGGEGAGKDGPAVGAEHDVIDVVESWVPNDLF